MNRMERVLFNAIRIAITNGRLRRRAMSRFEARLEHMVMHEDPMDHPDFMQEEKFRWLTSILRGSCRNLDRGIISEDFLHKALELFFPLFTRFSSGEAAEFQKRFTAGQGMGSPAFIVVSPTNACNLRCTGCYASCGDYRAVHLPYETFDRIIGEVHDLWQARFVVLSGGEPMMYRDGGRTIFDIFEKYEDMFFLFFTNGTLIDHRAAARMAELGSVTPAISVEGYQKETDARRGNGTFERILRAQEILKEHGVPFGVSVTATSLNIDRLLTREFYEYWFDLHGSLYMWLFHLMPIGRARDTMGMMIAPEERLALRSRLQQVIADRKYSIADFWNSGILSDGCIAYGKQDGYLYIDWDGKIMPCVFVPYYEQTVHELYERGGNLIDALKTPLMRRGRDWQCAYQGHPQEPKGCGCHTGNLLRPCSIRDHYANFLENILTEDSVPEEANAAIALEDDEYRKRMCEFDDRLRELSDPLWEEYYDGEIETVREQHQRVARG